MKKISINIAGREIGPTCPPFVIAEMSANHNGSIERAMDIILAAKHAGADAVKMQTYTPDTITLPIETQEFIVEGGLWNGRSLYNLYAEAYTPWEWHKPLFDYAQEVGITLFSSPFDHTAVDLLEDMNAPAYKIASFEAVDIPLIKYAASTRKPLIISTGMASKIEIAEAIDAAYSTGNENIAILHCVSGYPAQPSEYNLLTIPDLVKEFNLVTGLSDHTLSNTTSIVSVALGASIVEKHFTLDRRGGGPDDTFSLEPSELRDLCSNINIAWEALGHIDYGLQSSEVGNIKFRRSLYFVKNLKKGEVITSDSIRSVRPGYGMPPKFFDNIIGKAVKKDVSWGSPVTAEVVDNI
jgi:pseudaminic acid synthase